MIVKIKSKNGRVPAYAKPGDAGMDVTASIPQEVLLRPLDRVLIPTGLFVEIPVGYEIQVRPRSGLALKSGITVLNTPGTIDSGYRGEIGIILFNTSDKLFAINDGDRVAQLVLKKVEEIEWQLEEDLSDSDRGIGGFGHTGIH